MANSGRMYDIVVQSLSRVWPFATPWTAAHQVPCASLFPGVCSNSCPWFGDAIQPSHSLAPLSPPTLNLSQHLQVIYRSFPVSGLFTSFGQSIGASAAASVPPMNIQGDFLKDWLIWSPFSPRDSRVFSSTTIQKHHFTHWLIIFA